MRFMMLMIPKGYENVAPGTTPDPKAIAAMMTYNDSLRKAGVLLALDGLHPPLTGARVSFLGGKPTVTDGPFAEAKEVIGGYWMIQVRSREEAIEWASRCPASDNEVIEVRQVFEFSEFPAEARGRPKPAFPSCVASYALLEAKSLNEAIEWTTLFLKVGGKGKCEVRWIISAPNCLPRSGSKTNACGRVWTPRRVPEREGESMRIQNVPVLVVLATVMILAFKTRGTSVICKADETNKSGPAPPAREGGKAMADAKGQYANVNGLKMYYEIHGTGRPLVLLHGAFGVATVYPILAKDRQVIAVELQGHGHTADVHRPLTCEQMADDTAALLEHLKIQQADFFGYSMGGTVALGVAIRHPGARAPSWPLMGPVTAIWRTPTSPIPPRNSGASPPTSRRLR